MLSSDKTTGKRIVIIREELVQITHNPKKALLLEQIINLTNLHNGWFRKTAQQLSQETLGLLGAKTCQRLLSQLIEDGWVEVHKENQRVFHYRANLDKINGVVNLTNDNLTNTNLTTAPLDKRQLDNNYYYPVENYVDNPVDNYTARCVQTAEVSKVPSGVSKLNPPYSPLTIPLNPPIKTISFRNWRSRKRKSCQIKTERQKTCQVKHAAELALLDTFVKVYVKRLGRYPRFAGLGRNGLPHPKIFAACRRFVGEQLTPEQFERVVISSLDSLSPPADLSELWGWWVRVGGSRGNLDWVLELAASLVRTARHPSGMVSLGSVLKQVLTKCFRGRCG